MYAKILITKHGIFNANDNDNSAFRAKQFPRALWKSLTFISSEKDFKMAPLCLPTFALPDASSF